MIDQDSRKCRRQHRCCSDGQAVQAHDASLFFFGIDTQQDNLPHRSQNAVRTRLKDSPEHQHRETSGNDTQDQSDNKDEQRCLVQPDSPEPREQKRGDRNHDPHAQRISAAKPLAGRRRDLQFADDRR